MNGQKVTKTLTHERECAHGEVEQRWRLKNGRIQASGSVTLSQNVLQEE